MIPASIRSDADELLRVRYGVGRTVLRVDPTAPLAGRIAFVPMLHAYQEVHPQGRTLPGHDLDAREAAE